MIIPHIFSDAGGHSQFGEFDWNQTGIPARINSAETAVNFWQVLINQPGDAVDFQPTGMNKFFCVLSGQMDVMVSNGDVRHLGRGDMLMASDIAGQGHKTKFVGLDPCLMLAVDLPTMLK